MPDPFPEHTWALLGKSPVYILDMRFQGVECPLGQFSPSYAPFPVSSVHLLTWQSVRQGKKKKVFDLG